MPVLIMPSVLPMVNATLPTISITNVFTDYYSSASIPPGVLRLAGVGPTGLIKVAGVPAQKQIDLYDRITKLYMKSTVSDINGEFEFTELSNRQYDIIVRGDINLGQRDIIIPAVTPVL